MIMIMVKVSSPSFHYYFHYYFFLLTVLVSWSLYFDPNCSVPSKDLAPLPYFLSNPTFLIIIVMARITLFGASLSQGLGIQASSCFSSGPLEPHFAS